MDVNPALANNLLGLGGSNTNPPSLVIPEPNSQGYFEIFAGGVTGTSGRNMPFRKNGALYQVPASKVLKIVALSAFATTGNVTFALMSATATFADDTAAPTGAVYQSAATGGAAYALPTTHTTYNFGALYDIAASLWPGITITNNALYAVRALCKLVDA